MGVAEYLMGNWSRGMRERRNVEIAEIGNGDRIVSYECECKKNKDHTL